MSLLTAMDPYGRPGGRPAKVQYLSIRYTERLAEVGAAGSVGSRGDSYDNALAESAFGLYKAELITRQGPCRSVEDVELATLTWAHWWNNRRLHTAIGDIPPAEYEAAHLRSTTTGRDRRPALNRASIKAGAVHRWRLGLAPGESRYDDLEKQLATGPLSSELGSETTLSSVRSPT